WSAMRVATTAIRATPATTEAVTTRAPATTRAVAVAAPRMMRAAHRGRGSQLLLLFSCSVDAGGGAETRLSALPAFALQQLRHSPFHLVSNLAHALERLPFRVFERPIRAAQPWNCGARFAAAHRDEQRRAPRELVG